MDSVYYFDVKKAYTYFSDTRKFDDEIIEYIKNLFTKNYKEAAKALKLVEEQLGTNNFASPYGEIFYCIFEEMTSPIYFDYQDL